MLKSQKWGYCYFETSRSNPVRPCLKKGGRERKEGKKRGGRGRDRGSGGIENARLLSVDDLDIELI